MSSSSSSSLRLPTSSALLQHASGGAASSPAQFLSRFRSLNARHLVAGCYYNGYLHVTLEREPPAFIASSSPPVDGSRFSLDFLWSGDKVIRDPKFWRIVDSRGGLLLLSMEPYSPSDPIWHVMSHCLYSKSRTGPFLLDGDLPGGIDLSNFRLMCVADGRNGRCYRGSMFTSRDLDASWRVYTIDDERQKLRSLMGRTRAAVYWHDGGRTVTSLDRSTAKLLSSELPESAEHWDEQGIEVMVVAGRDGEPRVLAVAAGGGVLRVFAMPRGGGEWELEKMIGLSAVASGLPGYLPSYFSGDGKLQEAWSMNVTDVAVVTVSVSSLMASSWEFMDSSWAFRLDLETLEAELVDMDGVLELDVAFPCELPWPPVLRAGT